MLCPWHCYIDGICLPYRWYLFVFPSKSVWLVASAHTVDRAAMVKREWPHPDGGQRVKLHWHLCARRTAERVMVHFRWWYAFHYCKMLLRKTILLAPVCAIIAHVHVSPYSTSENTTNGAPKMPIVTDASGVARFDIPQPNVTLDDASRPWLAPQVVVVVTWVGPTREVLADTATIRFVGLHTISACLFPTRQACYSYAPPQPYMQIHLPCCSSCSSSCSVAHWSTPGCSSRQ